MWTVQLSSASPECSRQHVKRSGLCCKGFLCLRECVCVLEGVGVQALGACVLHCATAQNANVKIHA